MESYSIHYCIWLPSFCIMSVKFIYVVPGVSGLFLFVAEWYFIIWMYHSLFIHSPDGIQLDYFYWFDIMSTSPMSILAHNLQITFFFKCIFFKVFF